MSARFLLYRRDGTYYFRWTIPLALRRRMQTGSPADVRLSLRTTHFPSARELAARHWAAALDIRNVLLVATGSIRYKDLLNAIRGRVSMAEVSGGLVSLVELAGTADVQRLVDTLAILDARGAEFFIEVPPVGVTVWVRSYDDDGEASEEILEALDDFADPAARLTRASIQVALAAQRNLFEVCEFNSDQPGMWRGPATRREYHRVVPVPAFSANLSAIKVPSNWRAAIGITAPPVVAAAVPSRATDCDPILLSLARDTWVRANSTGGGTWSKSTQDNYGAAVSQFIDIVGDKLTTELTADDFARYENLMRSLPADWANARRRTGLSFPEIALRGADKPKVAFKTLKDKGGALSTFFQYLKESGYWHGRYGKALFGTVKLKSSRRVRHTFTDADLQEIFAGRGMDAMRKAKFPLYVWGAILLLYTGARPAEVSQLKRQDVMQDPNGTWYLQFREEQDEDDAGGPVQALKTEASFRAVPLHPAVLDLGFLRFIDRFKDSEWLFPEAFRHRQKVSREIGDWANKKLLTAAGLKAPGVVLYSLRHTVINRFKRDATAAYLACAYTGHATDADRPMTNREFVETYGKNFTPSELASKLHPLLNFPIDWQPLNRVLSDKRWT